MDKEYQLLELKSEYVRIQGDIEKMGSVGRDTSSLEQQLEQIESQIKEIRSSHFND